MGVEGLSSIPAAWALCHWVQLGPIVVSFGRKDTKACEHSFEIMEFGSKFCSHVLTLSGVFLWLCFCICTFVPSGVILFDLLKGVHWAKF